MPFCETVTHVAGPVVTIQGRSIQRCVVCGEKLCDSNGQMGVCGPGGEPPMFVHWAERALVRVAPGSPTELSLVGDFVDTEPPEDFCLALVE